MIYKEEVCAWFKGLSVHRRIDMMVALLKMCHPFEHRFLGSCLEDLAKSSFYILREFENKANDAEHLRTLTDVNDENTRHMLFCYLCLLHTSNSTCSEVMFHTLKNIGSCLDNVHVNSSSLSRKYVEEIILLLTLASYHPAFSFHNKEDISHQCQNLRNLFEDLYGKVCIMYSTRL